MRDLLQWAQRILFGGATVLLGYFAFIAADTWIFQQRESHDLQQQMAVEPGSAANAPKGLIGRLEIPRLGLSVMLMEGDDTKTLRRAVGRIPGTVLPGQPGNIALSGRRDTFFRPLRNIRANGVIDVNPGSGQILTLVTCYPLYFVGAAPDWLVVRAERLHYSLQHNQGREA
jgi:sortase A